VAKILFLKPRRAAAAKRPTSLDAEIIFFPGVRYEPLIDGEPRPRSTGRRWSLLPPGALPLPG